MTPRPEDVAFAAWQENPTPETEANLRRLLVSHASAVSWNMLGRREPDILNRALYLVWRYAHQFRGESKFSTWFHAIVKNECHRELRRRIESRTRERAIDELGAEDMSVLSTTINPEVGRLLEQVAAHLKPADQQLLALKRRGLTDAEIAAELKVTPEAVWKRWERLRRRVVSWLGEGRTHAGTLVGTDSDRPEETPEG